MITIYLLIGLLRMSVAISIPSAGTNNNLHSLAIPARIGFGLENGGISERALFNAINNTLIKYNSPIVLPPLPQLEVEVATQVPYSNTSSAKRRRQVDEPLKDNQDLDYEGSVIIGQKTPQTFSMDFDTGSSDIVIPGPYCGKTQGCPHSAKYDISGTDEHHKQTFIYGGGNATGWEYIDLVTVAGLSVADQGLLSVTDAAFFANSNYDGLFGMAFTGASGSNVTTFMENLIAENKQLSAPEFSFYLDRAFNGITSSSTSSGGNNSQLTLGGRDTTKYTGSITEIPVVNQTAWIVEMDGLSVNGVSAGSSTKGLAGIDTGTSFIVAPLAALNATFALIPHSVQVPITANSDSNLVMFAYPCNTTVEHIPTINLGGGLGKFAIDPEDFSLGTVDQVFAASLAKKEGVSEEEIMAEGLCLSSLLGVQDNVNPHLWVLGDAFLKGWWSVFSYGDKSKGTGPSVGFAKAV